MRTVKRILYRGVRVVRYERLFGHKPHKSAIIQSIRVLPFKLDHDAPFEIVGPQSHNFYIAVLKYVVSSNFNLAISRVCTHSRLRTEVDQLSGEIALVLRYIWIERRRKPWVIPRYRLGVVVNEIRTICRRKSQFLPRRQWTEFRNGLPP